MICEKCGKNLSHIKAKKYITYEGIDEHHNPPTFMLKTWVGEIMLLCRKHHKKLHDEILKIMFRHSLLRVPKKSEYWTWIKILPINRKKCIDEIIKFTKGWINDTNTT